MDYELPTKEEYIGSMPKIIFNLGWTVPKYKCIKCGG